MTVRILTGDCRDVLGTLPDKSVNCCVTSPPYFGLRDYGVEGQIGLEQTPDAFVAEMVAVFREVRRVLRDDGTLWLNLGDSYAGSGKGGNPEEGKQATNRGSQSVGVLYGTGKTAADAAVTNVTRKTFDGIKAKDLIGIPWRVAFALQADGWYLRQDIIWSKPNPMPESVQDRCTKAHEYLFLLSKSARYHFDAKAIAEDVAREFWGETVGPAYMSAKDGRMDGGKRQGPGPMDGTRNKRSVWTVATQPFKEAHFATFPPDLIEPCIKAGCPVGGTVIDPFGGAGTTGLVADRLQRDAILIELNPAYVEIARNRLTADAGMFGEVA
jgi:DNA modification methylase